MIMRHKKTGVGLSADAPNPSHGGCGFCARVINYIIFLSYFSGRVFAKWQKCEAPNKTCSVKYDVEYDNYGFGFFMSQ